ncbi:Alcohol dehydrogenase GroES domain protein [Beutenbergia cavernae DSM 12333]|uniref:Alcohol dehydrogenase GroES domain protein n=1 Tax=Beutenbergia cavernae (strain ATCC BAA-8 / DSM 12333 / CCUG 43141 / JCM 11478 / NBRC 16432 / NCIMB 13614 / HKI 0122) TaxID=471853 RepID=C5C667_BEUC1|nr:zinc-binding dehydrogenase [Beutenbergia cavernae]ACQ82425.1 Alcohol dehydrogenase GroES domain protein [Beutenbergia cavernae DSM 12333]
MHAVRKTGPEPGDVELQEVPRPTAGPGQVVVDVAAAGLCGTDLHILDGSYGSRPPVTLGHEVSGTIAAVGPGVDAARVGERVALETFFSTCGECRDCRGGSPNRCESRVSIGSGADGGFAEQVVVPARNARRLPDHVPLPAGALSEPLACVCRSLFHPTPAVRAGDRVLVVGPGAIGLLAAQVARVCGGEPTVLGTPADAERLDVARALGLACADDPADAPSEVDVVLECSGSGAGMALGIARVRRGGRYVQIGQRGDAVPIDLARVSFHELVITGGFASTPESWDRAMLLLERGLVDLEPLVGRRYPLSEWPAAFDAVRTSAGVKQLLCPDGAS